MSGYPSIFATVVFDLHPKVKAFLEQLNSDGQIDLDPSGYPYLISVDRMGTNFVARISRNNRVENFVLNPRKQVEPVCSWNPNDGFMRPQQKQVSIVQAPTTSSTERKKVTAEAFAAIVESILGK
jgi:hypothetical protein